MEKKSAKTKIEFCLIVQIMQMFRLGNCKQVKWGIYIHFYLRRYGENARYFWQFLLLCLLYYYVEKQYIEADVKLGTFQWLGFSVSGNIMDVHSYSNIRCLNLSARALRLNLGKFGKAVSLMVLLRNMYNCGMK